MRSSESPGYSLSRDVAGTGCEGSRPTCSRITRSTSASSTAPRATATRRCGGRGYQQRNRDKICAKTAVTRRRVRAGAFGRGPSDRIALDQVFGLEAVEDLFNGVEAVVGHPPVGCAHGAVIVQQLAQRIPNLDPRSRRQPTVRRARESREQRFVSREGDVVDCLDQGAPARRLRPRVRYQPTHHLLRVPFENEAGRARLAVGAPTRASRAAQHADSSRASAGGDLP